MKLRKFDDNDHYVAVQRKTDRRKSKRSSVEEGELKRLSEYLIKTRGYPSSGICHGVRRGIEVLMLRKLFRGCSIIGTDLIYDDPGLVVNADFHVRKDEWVVGFDFLYSNSLDHSHSPKECFKVWMEQLKPSGLAFIQWTTYDMNIRGGDCFGATLQEYMELMSQVGSIVDLLYCGKANMKTLVVIAPGLV